MQRRKRKLPLLLQRGASPRPGGGHILTYHEGLEWMRKNCTTLDMAISLLRMYPNLIQDSSLDSLWGFIKPLLAPLDATDVVHDRRLPSRTASGRHRDERTLMHHHVDTFSIPRITIRSSSSVCENRENSQKRLYVCNGQHSEVGSRMNAAIPFALSHHCFVQCSSPLCHQSAELPGSDMLLFLMNVESVAEKGPLIRLYQALSCGVPIIYIREPHFKLSDSLRETIAQILSPTADDRYLWGRNLASPFPSDSSRQSLDRPPNHVVRDPQLSSSIGEGRQVVSALYPALLNGYSSALLYNNTHHVACMAQLLDRIARVLDLSISYDMDFLQKTWIFNYENRGKSRKKSLEFQDDELIETTKFSDESSETSLSSSLLFNSDTDRDTPPSKWSPSSEAKERETIYVLFSDEGPKDQPKVVKWPPLKKDLENDIYNPFADSPISFCNVDLSLETRNNSQLWEED